MARKGLKQYRGLNKITTRSHDNIAREAGGSGWSEPIRTNLEGTGSGLGLDME